MRIVDRSKDVIKSGGEWISSIDLENTALGCPGVLEACVVGVAHEKWDERPLPLLLKILTNVQKNLFWSIFLIKLQSGGCLMM